MTASLFSFLTALHLSTDKSYYDVMELLLEKGGKVNALDNLGQTALHRAAQQGNVQACKLLMAYNIGLSTTLIFVSACIHIPSFLVLADEIVFSYSLVYLLSRYHHCLTARLHSCSACY